MKTPIIAQLGLKANTLSGETVVITGAGGGIGYETARALLWLGANVVIAEINGTNGAQAEATLAAEFEPRRVGFVCTMPPSCRRTCIMCIVGAMKSSSLKDC